MFPGDGKPHEPGPEEAARRRGRARIPPRRHRDRLGLVEQGQGGFQITCGLFQLGLGHMPAVQPYRGGLQTQFAGAIQVMSGKAFLSPLTVDHGQAKMMVGSNVFGLRAVMGGQLPAGGEHLLALAGQPVRADVMLRIQRIGAFEARHAAVRCRFDARHACHSRRQRRMIPVALAQAIRRTVRHRTKGVF